MAKPVLTRMDPEDYIQRYGIPGHGHLVVEAAYSSDDGCKAARYGWTVRDRRFSPGIDKYHRDHVMFFYVLQDVRQWVREGGPDLWDPERRKEDKQWRPVPESMDYLNT